MPRQSHVTQPIENPICLQAACAERPPSSAGGYGDGSDQDAGRDVLLRPNSALVPYLAAHLVATQPAVGDSYRGYEGFPPGPPEGSADGIGEFDQYIGDSVVSGDYGPGDDDDEDDGGEGY